jgi:hypothetical protein
MLPVEREREVLPHEVRHPRVCSKSRTRAGFLGSDPASARPAVALAAAAGGTCTTCSTACTRSSGPDDRAPFPVAC